jgi:hypothetical protein
MLREATPYGCLQLSRREWFAALAVMVASPTVTAQQKPTGFHVVDAPLAVTEDGHFAIGTEVAMAVKPDTYAHRILSGLVGHTVQLSVFRTP